LGQAHVLPLLLLSSCCLAQAVAAMAHIGVYAPCDATEVLRILAHRVGRAFRSSRRDLFALGCMDANADVFAVLAKSLQLMGAVLCPRTADGFSRAPRGVPELFELLVSLADTYGVHGQSVLPEKFSGPPPVVPLPGHDPLAESVGKGSGGRRKRAHHPRGASSQSPPPSSTSSATPDAMHAACPLASQADIVFEEDAKAGSQEDVLEEDREDLEYERKQMMCAGSAGESFLAEPRACGGSGVLTAAEVLEQHEILGSLDGAEVLVPSRQALTALEVSEQHENLGLLGDAEVLDLPCRQTEKLAPMRLASARGGLRQSQKQHKQQKRDCAKMAR